MAHCAIDTIESTGGEAVKKPDAPKPDTDERFAWAANPVPLELNEHEIEAIVAILKGPPPPPTPALRRALARR